MEAATFVNEFTSSMNKAIAKLAKQNKCEESQVQIGLSLDERKENVYIFCKNYAPVKTIRIEDVLFLNTLYNLMGAKEKVVEVINNSLLYLKKENEMQPITVFITKSKVAGNIRMMLYVSGSYKSDITAEEIISLNKN